MKKNSTVIVYQTKTGAIELKGDSQAETIWATLQQIADLFDTDKSGISRHINNIFVSNELSRKATVANFATVQKEGARTVSRDIEFFNLDVILSVGYRVNSKKATIFRQWATKTLRAHIVDGYTINRKRITKNYEVFLKAVEDVKKLLPSGGLVDAASAMELVKMFASTWLSLDSYDKAVLPKGGVTKKKVEFTAEELHADLAKLKADLVKNHPFVDGNKRSGAFSFVWFLRHAAILNPARLTPEALTALTLLVAESDPKDKDRMVGLVLLLLN